MDEIVYAPTMCLCVKSVEAARDYTLNIIFSDGKRKIFDFKPLLSKRIYFELNNPKLFLCAKTDGCGVIWNDDIDIDPVYLYEHSTEVQ